jgi:hypothetical protein
MLMAWHVLPRGDIRDGVYIHRVPLGWMDKGIVSETSTAVVVYFVEFAR